VCCRNALHVGTRNAFAGVDQSPDRRLLVFHFKLYRHTAVSAALLFAASCSDAPTGVPPSQLERAGTIASKRDRSVASGEVIRRTFSFAEDVAMSATISPDGGVLAFPEAGLFLLFPPGAVSQTTVVTATAFKGSRVAYDFQPHGLTFATPIYIAQVLMDTELNTPRAMKKQQSVWAGYLSNGAEDLLPDGSANFAEVFDAFFHGSGSERLVVFSTTHFSGYCIATGVRGTLMPREGE
jgi:hypothetical protein